MIKLVPRKISSILVEIVNGNRDICNWEDVRKWKTDFSELCNGENSKEVDKVLVPKLTKSTFDCVRHKCLIER